MQDITIKIVDFNRNRLPGMVQLKYEAMAENIYRFFRGTCHLFYENLLSAPLPQSPKTWICGDLHLENFGSYKGNNKLVYFDLNDFDEAICAPALWEVARLVTSIFIAFDVMNIGDEKGMNMAILFLRSYSATLATGKPVGIDPRTAKGIVRSFLKKAEHNSYANLLVKKTEKKKRKLCFCTKDEHHSKIKKTLKKQLIAHIAEWIKTSSDGPYNYKVLDVVFRIAGTGSLGVKRYLFLLKSTNTKGKYLLLDMKQSFPSALEPYINDPQTQWLSESMRIISVQQRMQNVFSSLLSTTNFQGDSYVIQELQPVKNTIKFKLIKDKYRDLCQVIDDMAILTASSQLRSGGMDNSATIDELREFGTRKDWQDEILRIARQKSISIKQYYKEFSNDYKAGLLKKINAHR